MAKDKYEQAAMKDITKENADQEATAQVSYRTGTRNRDRAEATAQVGHWKQH
jgi:hypothetical protein